MPSHTRTASAAAAVVVLLASACGGSPGAVTQSGDRQKLSFALETARCMRAHGFPTYPDPAGPTPADQGSGTRFSGTGIDVKSARFQTAERTCEQQARRSLGLP